MALQQPELGQFSVAEALAEQGLTISASGVRSIWKRHGLETAYKRLLAKTQGATAGDTAQLSEAQQDLLRREQVTRRLRRQAEKGSNTLTDVRREELLRAAAKIFSRKGFAGTSLKEICSGAGIQSNSLYYHFASKEDLFAAVHQRSMQRTTDAIRSAIEGLTDPVKRLEEACATAVKFILDRSAYAVIARVDVSTRPNPSLQKRLNADRAEFEEIFRELVDEAPLGAGTDRSMFRLSLIGAMNWTNAWYKPGRLAPEEIGRVIVRNILRSHPS